MATSFVEAVRTCLREGCQLGVDEEDGEEKGGRHLCGVEGRLFSIDYDFSVGEVTAGFDAIGAGGPVAFGALHAQDIFLFDARRAKRKIAYSAEQRLIDGLRVADRGPNMVRKPYVTVRSSKRTALRGK